MSSRIAIVTTSYPRQSEDAGGHFVRTEAHELARAGDLVTVFAAGNGLARQDNPRVIWVADAGATGTPGILSRLRARPWRALGLCAFTARVLEQLVRSGPFDRIIAHWLMPSAFPTLLAPGLSNAELEVVIHGSDLRLAAALPAPLARAALRALFLRGVQFRCVSNELAEMLVRLGGEPLRPRVSVRPSPIEVSGTPNRFAARTELGVAPETRLAVIVGRLIAGKRPHDAIGAALLVPELELVVIGDGPLRPSLSRQFPCVRFLGQLPRDRTLLWMRAADVLLSASRLEGAPTAIREARALDLPVVTTPAADLPNWAEADGGLWVVG